MKTYLIHFTTTYQCFARVRAECAAAAEESFQAGLDEYIAEGMMHIPEIEDADDHIKRLDEYDSANPPLFDLMGVEEED